MIRTVSILRIVLLSCFVLTTTSASNATDFYLFYLGGQSNMDGYGFVEQLPEELNGEVEGVLIFQGNQVEDQKPTDGRGKWTTLRPGHGKGFWTDGNQIGLSKRFGCELTFGHHLRTLMPGKQIALVKYSRGGTSIAEEAAGKFGCWEPDYEQGSGDGKGINQYDHFLAVLRQATSDPDLDDDGEPDRLIPAGILWMQGESDATLTTKVATAYESNLKRLIDLIRAAMRVDDLPVVIGRISDSHDAENGGKVWPHGEIVRSAQAEFVRKDGHASLVTSTDQYGYSDRWHYDTDGFVDLGREFAKAIVALSIKH